MSLIKYRDLKKNKENPFLKESLEVVGQNIAKKYKSATKTGEKAILKAIDESTGEILGHTQFIRQIEVDEEQFTKLYLSNFSAFWELKVSAIKVFGYIMTVLIPNKDEFMFFLDDCLEYTGYTAKSSIYTGITQLIEKDIIAKGRNGNMFFINPMVAFNGNRITFAKSYVKKKKAKTKEIDPNQVNFLDQIKEPE